MTMLSTRVSRMLMMTCAIGAMTWCISCSNQHNGNENPPSAIAPGAFMDKDVFTDASGTAWIPVPHAVKALGLRMKDSEKSVQIGFTDPMYEVYPDRQQALSLGKPTKLKAAPTRLNGQLYMTADSLSHLLRTPVRWDQANHRVEISALRDPSTVQKTTPTKQGSFRITSTVDKEALVSYATTFSGVPYDFGAEPYKQSKAFDCSSFTQHVFKHFGVTLPRLARDQGDEGTAVKRDNLSSGDLIFFTVPGRFEKDSTPGHVGIYIGDGRFIHTWGAPGVQISKLDTGYWSNVILFMRRVL